MNTNERLSIATEYMEALSDKLLELSNLISTVHLGLMSESVERQSLDCLACIYGLVNELHGFTENGLMKLKGKTNMKQ